MTNKEVRYIPVEVRDQEQGRQIYGRAIVFDSYSNNLGFYEKINRSAITQELIDNSDIVFNFNHDNNQVLARRRKGEGTLDIELREDGVYFSFEAPNTTLGNDLLEQVKRGDISTCSFCFTVSQEENSQKWEKRDGVMYREIFKIDGLYDLSAVTYEAYSDTSINARSLELRDLAEKEVSEEVEEKPEEKPEEKEESIPEEIRSDEPEKEEPKEEEKPEEKEESETEEEKPEEEEKRSGENANKNDINNKNKTNHNIMKKLLQQEIRELNNGENLKLNAETRTISVGDQGTGENVVPGVHDEVVETEIQGILEPLYAKSVLTQLGVRWYTGLPMGDIQIPVMSKGSVTWEDELVEASESNNAFSSKKLQPKRLTAYVDISNKLLRQDTIGVETCIRRDIVNALQNKLEATILGAGAATTTQPAGIFNGATVVKNETYAKVTAAEAGVEENNVYGEMKYLMSPKAKAFYRSLIKGTNATGMVFENNAMDGTPAIVTSNVAQNNYVYGDFSQLAVGSWGDIDITVDTVTQARKDATRLVINAYFDAVVLRPEAFAFGKIA